MQFINDNHNTSVPQSMDHNEPCVVLLYANWCPHCQVMEPEWNDATDEMEQNVKVIKIESNELPEYQDMLHSHGAHSNGFPTIYAFKPGKEPQYYGGERKKDGFISWVKNLFPMSKKKETKKKATKKKGTKKKGTKKKGTKKAGGYIKQDQNDEKKQKKQKKQKKGKGDRSRSRSKSVF